MASKFQNRLVGTVILVALGVIILPGLLDGQKKHYQDEFAAIPLVPKPGDTDEPDMLPAAAQALPSQPPEGAAEEIQAGNAAAPRLDVSTLPGSRGADIDEMPVVREKPQPKPVVEKPKPKPAEKPRSMPASEQIEERLAMGREQPPKVDKPARKEEQTAPTGKAYVVQLGALKNAERANEIVGKLRAAGYKAYTSPSTPVQGQITRILVGPDASKEKLKGSLSQMNAISGLNGVVMNYSAR